MEPSKIYLRLKREKKVFFFECQLTDIVEVLKRRLTNFYKQEPAEMRLYYGTRVCIYIQLIFSCLTRKLIS
jgi:hypothetical protein